MVMYTQDQFIQRDIPKRRQKEFYSASNLPLTIDWRERALTGIPMLIICIIALTQVN